MYTSSSSVFMVNNMPSGVKKHCESAEPESRQMTKMFFFILLLQKRLHDFHDGFLHKTPSFYTEQCTSPSFFSQL